MVTKLTPSHVESITDHVTLLPITPFARSHPTRPSLPLRGPYIYQRQRITHTRRLFIEKQAVQKSLQNLR